METAHDESALAIWIYCRRSRWQSGELPFPGLSLVDTAGIGSVALLLLETSEVYLRQLLVQLRLEWMRH